MEIGSFIELQFPSGRELHKGSMVRRLNTGRAAIYYAFTQSKCDILYLPVYQCHSVGEFLLKKGVKVKYYNINTDFSPELKQVEENACVLLVNYFGIIGEKEMRRRRTMYKNVIIDNAPAFYANPIENTYNIYSARKFFGVPDGAYVVSTLPMDSTEFPKDYSSDTASFLLKRIEYGCEGKVYAEREENEKRLDNSDIKLMSELTYRILDGINYESVKSVRQRNFDYAHSIFNDINHLNPMALIEDDNVPMVYPLMMEDPDLLTRLLNGKHFQGHWWQYILNLPDANDFEKRLSSLMVPITIDQRYNHTHLDYIKTLICK